MARYIWQHSDWPRFRWDASRLLAPLSKCRRAQGALLGRTRDLGVGPVRTLRSSVLEEEAVRTAAIEGEVYERAAVRSSVAHRLGLPTAGLATPSREIDGLVQVLLDATTGFDAPLTAQRLHGWHAALFPTGNSGMQRIEVAQWRSSDTPMQVVSGAVGAERVHFEAPPREIVEEEMAAFLSWWETGSRTEDGLLRAALSHLWFVTVHPYEDGNGRLARAVTEMALAQDEQSETRYCSLSRELETRRGGYYAMLERTQHGGLEVTDWFLWFLEALTRAIATADRDMDRVLAKARFWRHHSEVELNVRQRKALNRMLDAGYGGFEGGMTPRKYRGLTHTSRATAQRDLADLLQKGLVVRLPGGGRSTSYDVRWE